MLRRDDDPRIGRVPPDRRQFSQQPVLVFAIRSEGAKKQGVAKFLLHDGRQKHALLRQKGGIARQKQLDG